MCRWPRFDIVNVLIGVILNEVQYFMIVSFRLDTPAFVIKLFVI